MDKTKSMHDANNVFPITNDVKIGGRAIGKINVIFSLAVHSFRSKMRFLPKIIKYLTHSVKIQTSRKRQIPLGKALLTGALLFGITTSTIAVETVDIGSFTIQFWQKADGDPDGADRAVTPFRDFTNIEKEQIIRAFEYWAATIPASSATTKAVIRVVPNDGTDTGAAYSWNFSHVKSTTSEGGANRNQTPTFEVLAENRNVTPNNFTVTTPVTAPQPNTSFSAHSMIVINVGIYDDYRTPTQIIGNASNTSNRPVTQGMIHEIGHSLGVSGGQATDTAFPTVISVFDSHLRDSHGVAASNAGVIQSGNTYIPNNGFDLTTTASGFYAYFRGTEVDKLLGLTGVAANTPAVGLKVLGRNPATGNLDGNTLSHGGIFQSLMSYGVFRSLPFFSEVELAQLQDIGYTVDRTGSFGKSYYVAGTTETNTNGFGTKASPNTKLYGVGLHVFTDNVNIIQMGNIYANGEGGAGIRIDGSGNKITIGTNTDVYANGLNGIGLLGSVGSNNVIVMRSGSNLQGTGTSGYGARFDTGSSDVASHGNVTLFSSRPRETAEIDELKNIMNDAMVDRFDISGSISGTAAAIYIADNAHVKQINFMKGTTINGSIISDYTDGGRTTTLTFGKLANTNGEATGSGDSTNFAINIADDIGGTGKFDLETWGGETTLSAANLGFNIGTIGADSTNVKSTLNLPGTVTFSTLNLGSVNNTVSVLDGKTTGRVTATNGVANRITVQNLASLNVPAIDNYGVLADNKTIIVTGNADNNATVQILDTGTLDVGGKLTNAGLIDTAKLVEVTGDVDNSNKITNVTTLDAKADLNNAATGQLDTNTNIKVGGKLTNDGEIDTAKLVEVTGDVDNNYKITNVTTLDVKSNLNNNGNLFSSSIVSVGGKFTNDGWVDTAALIDVTKDIDNTGLLQNVTTLQTKENLNNTATLFSNSNIIVAGKLDNAGTIDGGLLVDVTGDIDNTDEIKNVTTLQTDADLNNAASGQIVSNTNVNVGGKFDNAGIVDTANLVNVTGDIDNSNVIQNVATLQTDADLNNTVITSRIVNNTKVIVGGKLENIGLVDTSTLVDVTGDIENNGLIQNVVTLQTAANLNNQKDYSQIVDNKTVNVGVDLTNNGTVDRFTTLNVGQDLTNNNYVNINRDSTVTIGRNGFNTGHVKINGNLIAGNQFTNQFLVTGAGTAATRNGFINNGTISPGNSIDTITVVGPFVNNVTGSFYIELDPSHYPSKPFAGLHNDLVDVNAGSATINGGEVFVASPSNDKTKTATPARYVGNTHYTFLDTDKTGDLVVNNVLTAHDPADILLFDFLADHDTKSYWLDVQREYYYGKFGDTFNQVAVGDYIDEIGLDPDPSGDFFGVLIELDKLNAGITHRAGISKAAKFSLDQMSGAIYGTIANAGIQNTGIVNNTLADVLRRDAFGNQNGCEPCETVCATKKSSRRNTWGLGYGIGGETQFDGNAYGYDQTFAGTLIGIDKTYKRNLRVGLFASYGEGKISSDLSERSKSKEFLAGLYLRKGMKIGYILASGGLGNNRYDTERTISFVNRKTKNKHDAIVGTVYLERGLELKNRYGILQPFFGIQYIGSQQNGFAEHGADSLNLVTNTTDGHSLRSLLGSRFSTNSRTVNKGKLSLYGNAIWMHEFLRSYTNFTAEFSNPGFANFSSASKFTVRGNDSKRDWAIVGVGLNYDK
ncbi:MAG: autotransporter domain-containing protein, partial [Planctomycetaceae bacterium]|nr:autotransporter domain-containing protein [Planctomycetaceae bacterium]